MLRVNRWLILVIVAFGAVILALAGLLKPVGEAARYLTLPVVRAVAGTSASLAALGKPSPDEASVEHILELEARLASLAIDNVQLQGLKEENQTLRAQARFLADSGYDSVGARVISRDVQDQQALLVIDRGQDDHVEVGQAVVTNEGVFIGKISLLNERVATVELLTDPHSRVAAAVVGQRGLTGVVEGRGNGASVLTYIPSSQKLKRDQLIETAGTEEKVPAHLPLGIVNAVEGKPTDPFLSAAIEPLVPLSRVVLVSVLRPTALRPTL